MRRMLLAALCFVFVLAAAPAWAIDVGSDGSDGALDLTGPGTTTIDLGLAVTGSWNTPGNGNGVYDPDKWAVVFKYGSVNIGAGRTVQFTNRYPSGAPVVWLVQGAVNIAGNANLDGKWSESGLPDAFALGGPGGFRGGRGYGAGHGSGGLGPGGGRYYPGTTPGAGGYGTVGGPSGVGGITYGNIRVLPLVGGSGGAGYGYGPVGGGGGGGAILVASNGTITLSGGISALGGGVANGGSHGGGSGGGIRLIADTITGSAGTLNAYGRCLGGIGRIRLEANNLLATGMSNPSYTSMVPLDPNDLRLWAIAGSPVIRVTTVGGLPVPSDPHADFFPPGDLYLVSEDSVTVQLEGTDIPVAQARRWFVKVRMVRRVGVVAEVAATFAAGDSIASQWTAKLPPLPDMDFVGIQARAYGP